MAGKAIQNHSLSSIASGEDLLSNLNRVVYSGKLSLIQERLTYAVETAGLAIFLASEISALTVVPPLKLAEVKSTPIFKNFPPLG